VDVSVVPGNSPCFQCLFLAGEEEVDGTEDFLVGAANAQRTMRELGCEEEETKMGKRKVET